MQNYINKECKRHGETSHKISGKKEPRLRCLKCIRLYKRKQLHTIKVNLVQQFGGKCEMCAYDKCLRSLEFHHLDPSAKSFEISKGSRSNSYESLLKETKKCILVCSNCHCEIEDGITKVPYHLVSRVMSV